MNPYDRRAVRAVWSRVRPDRDVFTPGPWPAPPPSMGQGGKPPGSPQSPGGPSAPNPPPEPGIPALQALALLAQLAAGYDALARSRRAPGLRRLAAQCRRNAAALRECTGQRPLPAQPERSGVPLQRERERQLRERLSEIDPGCARLAGSLARDSRERTRLLSRLR